MPNKQLSDDDYTLFREFLERQCGIVLGENKQYLVRSRLSPLMRKYDYLKLSDVVEHVVSGRNRSLRDEAIDAMTTNETLWFRDRYPFELLTNELLPKLEGQRSPVRIWCAACSSGQEPYSIAMTVHEYLKKKPGSLPGGVQITGTDLSTEMLQRCKEANYDSLSLSRGLSEDRKRIFFNNIGDGLLQVNKEVRDLVSFRPLNLLDSYGALGRFDIVFCRNVLIYFSTDVKSSILQKIAACMNNNGILFLGASESMSGLSDAYDMVRCNPGLYYTKK